MGMSAQADPVEPLKRAARAGGAVPGTQPEGIRDERAAAGYVREMFSRIAPRYDLLNHLLSFSLDRVWRRRTARRFRHILWRADARVLDLCCGTGDLTLALMGEARRGQGKNKTLAQRSQRHRGHGEAVSEDEGAEVWGSDFAHPMLVRAREKGTGLALQYFESDAMQLPVGNESFDLVTAAFGFRNLANYETGLREIWRVLRPGGEVGILEFAAPRSRFIGAMYKLYSTQIVPRLGGAVSGNRAAYAYLPVSVEKFPEREELHAKMREIGFVDARAEMWTFGIVALHRARKAEWRADRSCSP
jgi:demethylmenaquinone methyltransferase/2-methoxy-6-polyprenyl-1,4-benzoquinol methylase